MIILDVYQSHISVPKGLHIGITSGCFDMLHFTQVNFLNQCKDECDFLIVAVDADHLCRLHKQKVPVINIHDRMFMVSNLKAVNRVVMLNSLEDLRKLAEIISINNKEGVTTMFKNRALIYDVPLIEIDGVKNEIIQDINRFSSTTEILDYIQSSKRPEYAIHTE